MDDDLKAIFSMLEKRLADIECELKLLRSCIVESGTPKVLADQGLRVVVFKGTPEAARKMRVAKAAKRNGFTYGEWVAKYGDRETNPAAKPNRQERLV
ncbi:MAG: hypothetical protein IID31_10145 [Planctomycetes bacterium]|nr:hypothetical protein [Planctomycetota bacterium]